MSFFIDQTNVSKVYLLLNTGSTQLPVVMIIKKEQKKREGSRCNYIAAHFVTPAC